MSRRWEDHEIKMLGTMSDADFAKEFNRGEEGVRTMRIKLRIRPFNLHKSHAHADKRSWSMTEDLILGTTSDAEVARLLGRSRPAVQARRASLGIAACEVKQAALAGVLSAASSLAESIENTPLWQIHGVREGAITIQQQAARYASATDDETRADAATWAREGYQILSSALPDTYCGPAPDERKTGWQTAHDIARLFGAEFVWLARVRLSITPAAPDATRHDPAVDYLRGLIELTGLSQREVAERIGIGFRLLKYYITTPRDGIESRVAPYPVQYAMEMLAAHS